MARPLEVFIVRHGKTWGNWAFEMMQEKKRHHLIRDVRNIVSYYWRLTDEGREQADLAAKWFRENVKEPFDIFYASDTIRTRETAGRLQLPGAKWRLEPLLRERSFGLENIMSPCWLVRFVVWLVKKIDHRSKNDMDRSPLNGDSDIFMQLCFNAHIESESFRRETSDHRVIFVLHEDKAWACRIRLERIRTQEDYEAVRAKEQIRNCNILHYSRINPETGEISDTLDWMRLIDPVEPGKSTSWRRITRKTYSNEELLADVEKYPNCKL